MRKLPWRTSLLLAVAGAACHDSSGGGGQVSFETTVTDLIQNQTSDTGEPIEVDGTTFAFDEDPNAFDGVLPPDTGTVVGP